MRSPTATSPTEFISGNANYLKLLLVWGLFGCGEEVSDGREPPSSASPPPARQECSTFQHCVRNPTTCTANTSRSGQPRSPVSLNRR
ncbi:hypothetical protein E2C01_099040 [Portunus trituberculatus]|uniref:Uncharacterized protein n=1 Tax=Portunus trituberculatus TaxID=210409 RepID=A0A5B7JZ95_PORTR|nr:hypothetical protein [Portunus trituberculatus]